MKQESSNRLVRIFSARTCAAPLEKAANSKLPLHDFGERHNHKQE